MVKHVGCPAFLDCVDQKHFQNTFIHRMVYSVALLLLSVVLSLFSAVVAADERSS